MGSGAVEGLWGVRLWRGCGEWGCGGECCRKCTVRRVGASYKASGPDASGAYNASYSVVQGVGARRVGDVRRVVQCRTRCRTAPTPYDTVRHSTTQYDTVRHSTTQYDTVRHSTTQYDTVRHGTTRYDTVRHSTTRYDTVRHGTTQYDTVRHTQTYTYVDIKTHVNGKKTDWSERGKMGPNVFPFWSKQSKRGNLKYWHFASTTCRQCLQLAGRVYLWCTVSTDPRPPSPSMRVNDGSGPFWGKGAFGPLPKYWHFASTTCRQCLQLAGRVYLWCTVSTDPRPPSPSMRVNDGSGPFWGKGAFGPLPKYWHFASTTCRQCLQLAGRVYLWCTVSTDPRPPSPSMRVNDGSGPFPKYADNVYNPTVYMYVYILYTVYVCVCVCVCVCIYIYIYIHTYIHTYIYIYMSYDTVRHCTTRRTVSYSVVPASYDTVQRVVLCRTVSYCVVLCRTVSYCVVLCRTVSYCVVLCRTSAVRHCTTRRIVSYSVVQCRTVSYKRRTTLYDASYCVVQGVGARRVGDVRRVVQCRTRCRGPTRRGCMTRREVSGPDAS